MSNENYSNEALNPLLRKGDFGSSVYLLNVPDNQKKIKLKRWNIKKT